MEVKAGYKQTEVGKIPEDWEVKSFGEVSFLRKERIDPKRTGLKEFCIELEHIEQGTGRLLGFTNTLQSTSLKSVFKEGDVLFGKLRAYLQKYWLAKSDGVCSTEIWVLVANRSLLIPELLFQFVKIDSFIEIASLAYGTHMPRSDWNVVKNYLVRLPTLAEQEAIAEALSDADAFIEALEQLITKKRQVKQGAMSELLTGKKRLPGFSEKWETEKVWEFGEVVTGGTPPTIIEKYWNGNIPWVTPTDISSQKDISTTEREITSDGLGALRKLSANSVLITCIASIGKNAILRKDGACNQQINAIVPNRNYNADFLYYLFENNKQYLLANAGITATSIISKKDFSELMFSAPKLFEQTAIAEILSDMDAEITALEKKLVKAREIKQGMMSMLLTGRIRLI